MNLEFPFVTSGPEILHEQLNTMQDQKAFVLDRALSVSDDCFSLSMFKAFKETEGK